MSASDLCRAEREPRSVEVVLGRAAVAGVIGGACLGASLLVPDLIQYLRPPEPDVYRVGPSGLLLGAAIGALVGLVAALAAAVAWLFTVVGPPPRPRLSRLVAGLAAAGAVVLISLIAGALWSGFTLPCAIVAASLAAALAPTIGYRARPE